MFNKIIAGLKIAEEQAAVPTTPEKDVPIKPFQGIQERAPSGFEFEKYKLMQPEDLRRFKPTLDKLTDRSEQIKEIDKKAKEMRVEVEEKIKSMQGKEGYEKVKTEMTQAVQKINDELIPYFKEAGNTLMAYKDTVFTVIDTVKKDPVTEQEKKAKLVEALQKFMSPEISGKVIETFDSMVAELAASAEKVKQMKELKVWNPSQKLREQIEKEVPKGASLKTADIGDMVNKFVGFLKGLWDSLSEKVGNFFAAKELADPIVDEMNQLVGEINGTQASKEKVMNKDIEMVKAGLKVVSDELVDDSHRERKEAFAEEFASAWEITLEGVAASLTLTKDRYFKNGAIDKLKYDFEESMLARTIMAAALKSELTAFPIPEDYKELYESLLNF